jgi:hypothetical protein
MALVANRWSENHGRDARIRGRWLEGECTRQMRLGLTLAAIAQVIQGIARGHTQPAQVGIVVPPEVTFPPNYTISEQRVWQYVKLALDRHAAAEVPQFRKLQWMRLEDMWSRLQPAISKGDGAAIDRGLRVLEREARLYGLDMPIKVAPTDAEGRGIPLEAIRTMMARLDEQAQTVETTALPAPTTNGNGVS